jgi:fumarylpyruvate hydrolase
MNPSSASTLWNIEPVVVPVKGSSAAFPVRRIYCVGRNYIAHIREMQEADERDLPFFFQKPTDSIVRDGGDLPYPPVTKNLQYEGELVVAIGTGGSDISVEDAPSHIFGYALGLDMTRRDMQREAKDRSWPWEMGKAFDASAPCGDITPVTQVGHLQDGRYSVSVNGEQRQHTSLSLMIWSVPEIIANLSAQYRLERGDLIYTGTPAGVGSVVPGDDIQVTAPGLESLTVHIR